MEKRELNILVVGLVLIIVVLSAAVGAGAVYIIQLRGQLATLPTPQHLRPVVQFSTTASTSTSSSTCAASSRFAPQWYSSQPAAADSVEGKLRAEGKHWVRTDGQIVPGVYVQDIFEGRLNQPTGRGAVGKVLVVGPNDEGAQCATVDFGRGYLAGVKFSELALVSVTPLLIDRANPRRLKI